MKSDIVAKDWAEEVIELEARLDSQKALVAREQQRQDSIANLVSGLGTSADLATHARPTVDALRGRLTDTEINILYLQNDLARRIVDELVDDAVRQGWEARDKETKTPVEEPEHLDIAQAVKKAGRNGRRTGIGAVLLITDEGAQDFSRELGEVETPKGLLVLDKKELTPQAYYDDVTDVTSSAKFNEPRTYIVSPSGRGNSSAKFIEAHETRMLLFSGAPLPTTLKHFNEGFDVSVLQSVWDSLRRFTETEQAIANIVQRFETATLSIAGLAEMLETPEGTPMILARVKLIQKTLSMIQAAVVDKDAGEEYSRSFAQVNGLDTIWDRMAHSVAKAAQTPMTQLFGMSPSGLSSDDASGRANWRKRVATYQDEQLRPALKQYYTLLNGGREVEIVFHPLDESTAKEEADIAKTKAETMSTYVMMGSMNPLEVRPHLLKSGIIEDMDLMEELDALIEKELANAESQLPGSSSGDVPEGAGEEGAGDSEPDQDS